MANNGASPLNRFLFVQRWPNGGYNPNSDSQNKAIAYNNASMPNFVPAGVAGVQGGGQSMYFDVIDGAQSFNGEAIKGGSSGSSSVTPYFTSGAIEGVTIGKIVYDEVVASWYFVATTRYQSMLGQSALPSATDANSDANAIKAFITSLNSGVIPVTGTANEVPLPPAQKDAAGNAAPVTDETSVH